MQVLIWVSGEKNGKGQVHEVGWTDEIYRRQMASKQVDKGDQKT